MNDYINKVHKIIYDDKTGTTSFIIQTDGDKDFWYWQVDTGDIFDYFKEKDEPFGIIRTVSGHLTKRQAEQFCNDIDNTDKGTSVASFDTIEDALKNLGI